MILSPPSHQSTAQWLARRDRGIGCSELPLLFRAELDPAKCAKKRDDVGLLEMIARKKNPGTGHSIDNRATQRGRLLENVCLDFAEQEIGKKVYRQGVNYDVPIVDEECHLCGSMDGVISTWTPNWFESQIGEPIQVPVDPVEGVIEGKTASGFAATRFGEPGTDEIPEDYAIQGHGYLTLTGAPVCFFPVLVGGAAFEFRMYRIERDEAVCAEIRSRCRDFWTRHIEGDEPPDVRGVAAGMLSAKRFPFQTSGILDVDDSNPLASYVRLLRIAQDFESANEDEYRQSVASRERAEGDIKAAIGSAEGIRCSIGTVTWKATKRGRVLKARWNDA